MKFGSSVADIFIIKHTEFGYNAFGLDNSTVHCLGVQFFRGHSVEQVHEFCYLGSLLTEDARCDKEIKKRIATAKAAFMRRGELLRET